MLFKKRHLNKELARKVLKSGKIVRGRGLSLKYFIIPEKPAAFTFVVSSRTVKSAVSRNKLKRRGRAVVFNFLPKVKKGCLALIFFEKGSVKMKFSEMKQEITCLFQKENLIR
jgi:ribonuclease P protein component